MRQRGIQFVLALLSLLLGAQLFKTLTMSQRRGDLALVIDAARRLRTGESLYFLSDYSPHTKAPLATLLFVPFSFLPNFILDRVWDLILIVGICFLFRFCRAKVAPQASWKLLWFVFLLAFNPLNTEIAFGQFNVLLLLSAAAAVYLPSAFWAGAFYAVGICFKPTQIVFLPWVLRYAPQLKQRVLGGVGALGASALIYVLWQGWGGFWADHQAWLQQTAVGTSNQLNRPDNYGLPALFVAMGMPAKLWWIFQLLGLGCVSWFCYRKHEDSFRIFAIAACVTVIASPMAWLYIYVLTVPWVFIVLVECRRVKSLNQRDGLLLILALAAYYWGTQFFNPTTEKVAFLNSFFPLRPPLWGLLIALMFWGMFWKRNRGSH